MRSRAGDAANVRRNRAQIAAARGTRRAGFDIVGVFEIEGRQGCPAPRQRRGARRAPL